MVRRLRQRVFTRLRNRIAAQHLLWKSRRDYVVTAPGQDDLLVMAGVLDPVATKVGAWLAGVMTTEVRAGERWVDMGCGTGVVGLAMAQAGARVTCVDVDARCVANARETGRRGGVAIEAVESDLFAGLAGAVDGVVYNAPFWPGEPVGRAFERAMYAGAEFEAIRRYRAESAGIPRVLLALSEAGARHGDARIAFGASRVVRRERAEGEWLILLEAMRVSPSR